MSIERSRIEKLEAAARMRPAGPKTAAEMTDEELCESIGGLGTLPEDISDEELLHAIGHHGRLPGGWRHRPPPAVNARIDANSPWLLATAGWSASRNRTQRAGHNATCCINPPLPPGPACRSSPCYAEEHNGNLYHYVPDSPRARGGKGPVTFPDLFCPRIAHWCVEAKFGCTFSVQPEWIAHGRVEGKGHFTSAVICPAPVGGLQNQSEHACVFRQRIAHGRGAGPLSPASGSLPRQSLQIRRDTAPAEKISHQPVTILWERTIIFLVRSNHHRPPRASNPYSRFLRWFPTNRPRAVVSVRVSKLRSA